MTISVIGTIDIKTFVHFYIKIFVHFDIDIYNMLILLRNYRFQLIRSNHFIGDARKKLQFVVNAVESL